VVALLTPDRMSTFDLYGYMTHLQDNAQSASAYEIQFWKKLFYPLACLVMVVLALPFAYLHFRTEGISGKVFGGIMLGISFVLINQFSAHFGLLNNWTPWWAAAMPSLLYLSLSLTAFFWLVLYR
jgi:lipopolysaccharide export system permease protein